MNATPECGNDWCPRPIHDNATLCPQCVIALIRNLDRIADLWPEFGYVFARQTRYSVRVGGRSRETPLPFKDVDEPTFIAQNTINAWALDFDEHHDCTTVPDAARWLATQIGTNRGRDDLPRMYDEIAGALAVVKCAVDRPADAVYFGPCGEIGTHPNDCDCRCHYAGLDAECDRVGGCGLGNVCEADLWAMPGAQTIKCRKCSAKHDRRERQELLLGEAKERLATAAEASRAVTLFGQPVKSDRIRKWKERGRILHKGHDAAGNPLYRIGDVIDLAREDVISDLKRKARSA